MELAELALFVRSPETGAVKTRLHSAVGPDGASMLYRAFVEDTIALCQRVREAGRVALTLWADEVMNVEVRRWAAALGTAVQRQPEGDLGTRMSEAFEVGLRRAERVLIIGSDAPTLPLRRIVAAFNALDDAELVLGPSNDGGYYAIGASKRSVPRFQDVRWSTPHALEDTTRANEGSAITMLSPWYDVDETDDLELLRGHLSVSPSAAPATARCLRELRSA
jgi:rSAM/selenodomain-associated transferase 1